MTDLLTPSLWSAWEAATDLQRTHFKTLAQHRAWSRTCGGCGEGDFIERKQRPSVDARGLQGHRVPVLPERFEEGVKPPPFKTPAGRVHACATPADRVRAARRA